MEIYISINGVLRNFLQKFEYHYVDYFFNSELDGDVDNPFEYRINYPIQNDDILKYFNFQSKEEYDIFTFIDFPLEIFGHTGLSYPMVISDLNKIIHNNQKINFTIIGVDELGKARPSTLFFLSRNGFTGSNIKFIKSEDISKEWKKCDIWITDDKNIIDHCPKTKKAIKFKTNYNHYFDCDFEINNLIKLEELCLKFSENTISSMLMRLLKNVVQNVKIRKRKIEVQ